MQNDKVINYLSEVNDVNEPGKINVNLRRFLKSYPDTRTFSIYDMVFIVSLTQTLSTIGVQ